MSIGEGFGSIQSLDYRGFVGDKRHGPPALKAVASACEPSGMSSFDPTSNTNDVPPVSVEALREAIQECSSLEEAYSQVSLVFYNGEGLDDSQKENVEQIFTKIQQEIQQSIDDQLAHDMRMSGSGASDFPVPFTRTLSRTLSIDELRTSYQQDDLRADRKMRLIQSFFECFGVTDQIIADALKTYIDNMRNEGFISIIPDVDLERAISDIIDFGLHRDLNYYSPDSGLYDFFDSTGVMSLVDCKLSLISQLTTFFKDRLEAYNVLIAGDIGGNIPDYNKYFIARAKENHFEVRQLGVDGHMDRISVPDDGGCLFASALIVIQKNQALFG